jgi:hypothetical protein
VPDREALRRAGRRARQKRRPHPLGLGKQPPPREFALGRGVCVCKSRIELT